MFVVVTDNRTSEVLYSRRMGPHEKMEARKFADIVADQHFCSIAPSDGHIPSGSGDIRVEFRPRKNDSLVIWSGEDFYFRHEGDYTGDRHV
ncbi:hypothetical protein [Methylobacterium fujisawaense]